MNSEWLADFIALAQSGSLSRAAQKRALTHSAFGRRIKQLEDWAGTALIERSQPVRLTPAGELLLKSAEDITAALAHLRRQLQQPAAMPTPLRLSTGHILGSHFFPAWYRRLPDTHPPMSVRTAGAAHAIRHFLDGEAELLLAYKTPMTDTLLPEKTYPVCIVGEDTIIPVSGDARHIRLDALLRRHARLPWLGYDASLSLKGLITQVLHEKGILGHLHSVFTADNYETLKAMAIAKLGIAWLPAGIVQADVAARKLFVLTGDKLHIPVAIALYRQRDSDHPALSSFWQSITKNTKI